MTDDPADLLAIEQAEKISAAIIAELTLKKGNSPLVAVLERARDEASAALVALTNADPEKPSEIRNLQNEFKRFTSLVYWLRDLVHSGAAASFLIEQMEEGRGYMPLMAIDPTFKQRLEADFDMPQQRINDL